jgi:hypothetical protein
MQEQLLMQILRSRRKQFAAVLLACLLMAVVAASADLLLFGGGTPIGLVTIDSILTGSLGGALVYTLLQMTQQRRTFIFQRLQEVAELNHGIRNALEIITGEMYLSEDSLKVRNVLTAVDQIQDTLERVYPDPYGAHIRKFRVAGHPAPGAK